MFSNHLYTLFSLQAENLRAQGLNSIPQSAGPTRQPPPTPATTMENEYELATNHPPPDIEHEGHPIPDNPLYLDHTANTGGLNDEVEVLENDQYN